MNAPESLTPIPDESQRRGQLLLRTLPILSIPIVAGLVGGILLNLTLDIQAPPNTPSPPLFVIVFLTVFFSALIMLVRLGRTRLSVYLLIGVWTLFTTPLALQNGVASVWPAMLILPICAAGLLIDGAASVSLAGLATILVLSLGWLETQGVVPQLSFASPPFAAGLPLQSAGFWTALFWSVAGLTFLLASGLQRALQQSRAHAAGLSQLSAQLEQRVQEQTAALLAQEREAAALEERARVAREIHDTIAQGLIGIVVQLGAAQRALAAASPDAPTHLELAQRTAREALAEARRSIWNLRASALERGTLKDALQGVVARQSSSGTATTFAQRGDAWQLSPAAESALLRVCQEALVNVAKHASATRATVVLEYAPERVRLSICDDGVGFAEEMLKAPDGVQSGFGLLGMRERIAALGGILELNNEGGARVIAAMPRQETES